MDLTKVSSNITAKNIASKVANILSLELTRILLDIDKEASPSKKRISYQYSIDNQVVEELERRRFSVTKQFDQREGSCTTIRWEY